MRTTIDINDELYRRAKQRAMRSGRPFKEVIENALRLALKGPEFPHRRRLKLPKSKASPGVRHSVDLDNSAALLEKMES